MVYYAVARQKRGLNGDVLCIRKLGVAIYDQRYGEGTGEILLDDVVCVGNETSLTDCQHSEFGDHTCDHYEDVSVMCADNFDITGIKTRN